MSQQVNLLHKPDSIDLSIWGAVGGAVAIFLMLLSVSVYNEIRLYGIRADVQETQQRIADAQKALQEARRMAGLIVIDALDADIRQMRQTIGSRRDLTSLIEKGEVGSPTGHSDLFTMLARLSEPGVWIQGVDVSKAGQSIAVTGYALGNEAIMRYANQLNQIFKAHQFQFTSVEMSKEELSLISESGPKTSTMKFKLY